jgi:hypothetical protein
MVIGNTPYSSSVMIAPSTDPPGPSASASTIISTT